MESRDDQRRGGGNPAPATTYIILSRSGAGYLGSYKHFIFISAILILLNSTGAFAGSGGFVIEANNAQPDVGIQVQGDTQISVGEGGHIVSCLSMKLSKAAETQRMSHRGFQSLCHIRVRTVQLPPTSL